MGGGGREGGDGGETGSGRERVAAGKEGPTGERVAGRKGASGVEGCQSYPREERRRAERADLGWGCGLGILERKFLTLSQIAFPAPALWQGEGSLLPSFQSLLPRNALEHPVSIEALHVPLLSFPCGLPHRGSTYTPPALGGGAASLLNLCLWSWFLTCVGPGCLMLTNCGL